MEAYKIWIRRNREYVNSLESLANGLTWFLPERFSESEIGPEAVSTVLGIITAINEHIIDTTPTLMPRSLAKPYSFPYSLCLSALKDTETLVEVVAQHYYGDDKKWNFIAAIEAIKVLVRLALFRNSGYKMLLQGGETPNNEKQAGASTSQHGNGGSENLEGRNGSEHLRNLSGQNKLEGKALSALSRFGENARTFSDPMWMRRVQHQHAIMEPQSPVVERPSLSTMISEKGLYGILFMMGEVLFVTRPLIYVLFVRKYGIRSWVPWSISFLVDIVGISMHSQATTSCRGRSRQLYELSTSEKDEVRRRKLLWAFYLMRDPFFRIYTRQKLETAERVVEPIPIIGFLTAKIVELVVGAQTRYTYMSAS